MLILGTGGGGALVNFGECHCLGSAINQNLIHERNVELW